jgi:choline dehydrogenase-like flavoprotein
MSNNSDQFVVVGSGPAGLCCAIALLKKGAQVTLLDIGVKHSAKLNASAIDWDNAYDNLVKPEGIPLKTKLGSLHAYNQDDLVKQHDCSLISSQSLGGLSAVWGRACLPYTDEELAGWPIRYEDLRPYYHLIEQDLIALHCANPAPSAFPYHSPMVKSLPVPQSLARTSQKLQGYFEVVSARIALNKTRKHSCTGCGHCLAGCPEDVLLDLSTAVHPIEGLYPNFSYVPNFKVDTFLETEETVFIQGVNTEGNAVAMQASKLFLACGPLATALIVLGSQQQQQEVDILDSQYFIIPFLSLTPLISRAELTNYHSSCQLMAEHKDEVSEPHRTHLQFYFYNEIFQRILFHRLPFLHYIRPALMPIFRHLGVVQGFLHSDSSARMTLQKMENGGFELSLSKQAPKTMKILRPILWKLCKAGLIPLLPALQIKLPGQSFHNGGSFPMQAAGGPLTTEPNGKLRGFGRVYIADSSAFPNIPATTITLTIMANAYRVGDVNA